ncbi:MAG TPA: PD-(D/E)XK nuclease family protein, partial [bacterium]
QRVPTVNELLDFFKKHWELKWKESLQRQKEREYTQTLRVTNESQTIEDYYQKGQLFVENYYHQYQPFDQDKTEGIELRVAFNLDPTGQYKMQGFIDRLGRDDEGTLWIHDYKTSSRKISAEDVKSEDQLALYQIGLEQNPKFGSKEKIKLIWHFVAFEKDQVVSERNPKEIDWLKRKYVSKIQTIEKAKEFPTKTGPLCQWCEFLTICADGKAYVENRRKKTESQVPTKNVVKADLKAFEPAINVPSALENVSPTVIAGLPIASDSKKRGSLAKISPDQLRLF